MTAVTVQAATNYGIKVAGVSVTSDNASNVTGSNISGTVTYNNSTKTLPMSPLLSPAAATVPYSTRAARD